MEIELEPLKCEVIVIGVGFEPNSSCERLIYYLAKCLSL